MINFNMFSDDKLVELSIDLDCLLIGTGIQENEKTGEYIPFNKIIRNNIILELENYVYNTGDSDYWEKQVFNFITGK